LKNKKFNDLIQLEKQIEKNFDQEIERKQNEYSEQIRQLDIHWQSQIQFIQQQILFLQTQIQQINSQNQQHFISNKQIHLEQFYFQKKLFFDKLTNKRTFLQNQIELFQSNLNQNQNVNQHLLDKNLQFISSSYQNKIQEMNEHFSRVRFQFSCFHCQICLSCKENRIAQRANQISAND